MKGALDSQRLHSNSEPEPSGRMGLWAGVGGPSRSYPRNARAHISPAPTNLAKPRIPAFSEGRKYYHGVHNSNQPRANRSPRVGWASGPGVDGRRAATLERASLYSPSANESSKTARTTILRTVQLRQIKRRLLVFFFHSRLTKGTSVMSSLGCRCQDCSG